MGSLSVSPIPAVWPSDRVVYDDGLVLAVDKPQGMIAHGGADTPAGDLLGWVESRSGGQPICVCGVLERQVSGIVLLAYGAAHRRRALETAEVRWTYHAAVRDPGLEAEGVLPPHRGAVRSARDRFRVLRRASGRALVELELAGWPPHHVRERLTSLRAPIVGDTDNGGEVAWRLMLHGTEIGAPGWPALRVPIPAAIAGALLPGAPQLGDPREWRPMLVDACLKRRGLAEDNTVYRLINDQGDGLPGVIVDRYSDWTVLSVSTEEAFSQRRALAEALVEVGARGVYFKRRLRADLRRADPVELNPAHPEVGEPARSPLVVVEGRLSFEVRLGGAVSTGLFPDQRENRQRILRTSGGARVANLFCYTGSFSVAAAGGGACSVTSVDTSGRALRQARDNFALNALSTDPHPFVQVDVSTWLKRAPAGSYDVVILDPPSFSTSPKGHVFSLSSGWRGLAEKALALLRPGGRLLAVTHDRAGSPGELRRVLGAACSRARIEARVHNLPAPLDCPLAPEAPMQARAVWLTLG